MYIHMSVCLVSGIRTYSYEDIVQATLLKQISLGR